MSLNYKLRFNTANKRTREKPYLSLCKELIEGKIRANDDFEILQYECALRANSENLNKLIAYNGMNCSEIPITEDFLFELQGNGFGICDYDHDNLSSKDIKEIPFISLEHLFLDYLFLEKLPRQRLPNYLQEDEDEDDEIDFSPSEINKGKYTSKRRLIKITNKTFFADILEQKHSKKDFLDLLKDTLEPNTTDKRLQNAQTVVEMFFVYDQIKYFHIKVDSVQLIFNSEQEKKKDKRTLNAWVNKVETAIQNYKKYS